MKRLLLAVLPLALTACSPGETSFTLDLWESSADPATGELSWLPLSSDAITCLNSEAWHTRSGGDLIVVSAGARVLTVLMDPDGCEGLPGALTVDDLFVRWSDSSTGILGIEVNDEQSADFGLTAPGGGTPVFAVGEDWSARRVGSLVGGSFDLALFETSVLDLAATGLDAACACDGLSVRGLETTGAITNNGDPL